MDLHEHPAGSVSDYYQEISGDTISDADWTIIPASAGVTVSEPNNTATKTSARVTATEAARGTFLVTCQITGASGQIWERYCLLLVEALTQSP